MAYYIKTLGIKNRPVSIYKDPFPRMLLSHMCFKTIEGKVGSLKQGDSLILYFLKNATKEFPRGGFIGVHDVLSGVYEDTTLFGERLKYIVDIHPRVLVFRNSVRLREISQLQQKSERLQKALKANLQAIGGLLEVEYKDYRSFIALFQDKVKNLSDVKKERQMSF